MKKVIRVDRLEKRLMILYSMRKEAIDHALENFHLTYEDYQVLRVLHYLDGVSLEYIKQETHFDSYIIQHITHHLQGKDYIEIKDDQIYLTSHVKKIYPQLTKVIQREDEKMMNQLSKDERNEIIEMLDKLIEYYE